MKKRTTYWDGCVDPDTKALRDGVERLSDSELLAVIMRTGSREENALSLASRVLATNHKQLLNLYDMDIRELMSIPGIGKTKALQLKAVCEIARRLAKAGRREDIRFDDAASIAAYYMEELRHRTQESFMVAFFDVKGGYIGDSCIATGSLSHVVSAPRDVFRAAIRANAAFVVVLHNHPSGDPTPSAADEETTGRLRRSGEILNIPLLDHIIIGDHEYYSFYESGNLTKPGG